MADTAADRFAGVEVIIPASDEPDVDVIDQARSRAETLAAMPKSWHDEVDAKLATGLQRWMLQQPRPRALSGNKVNYHLVSNSRRTVFTGLTHKTWGRACAGHRTFNMLGRDATSCIPTIRIANAPTGNPHSK